MKKTLSPFWFGTLILLALIVFVGIAWRATRPPTIVVTSRSSESVGMFDPATGQPRGSTLSPWPGHNVPASMVPGQPTPPAPLKSKRPPIGMFDEKTGLPRGAVNPNPSTP